VEDEVKQLEDGGVCLLSVFVSLWCRIVK
jgi:hypothetical protein